MSVTDQLRQHRCFSCNMAGRDFVVGDLHGELDKLLKLLHGQDFDTDRDRLFALGDLVDRGPDSAQVLSLLAKPWFFSVLGNHEMMLLEGLRDPEMASLHRSNGGGWFYRLPADEQAALAGLATEQMALAFSVETSRGRVGLMHATAPNDWATVENGMTLAPGLWQELVWDRREYNRARWNPERVCPVSGVDLVVHGHVSCETPWRAANRLWIDTLYRGGGPTLVALDAPMLWADGVGEAGFPAG